MTMYERLRIACIRGTIDLLRLQTCWQLVIGRSGEKVEYTQRCGETQWSVGFAVAVGPQQTSEKSAGEAVGVVVGSISGALSSVRTPLAGATQ